MMFALIKDASKLEYYGDVPEVFGATKEQAETYYGDWDDGVMLCEYLLPEMDEKIDDCLLDLSDIDYFNKDKCVALKDILEAKMKVASSERLYELYTILYQYVLRAIELGTGVVIEL